MQTTGKPTGPPDQHQQRLTPERDATNQFLFVAVATLTDRPYPSGVACPRMGCLDRRHRHRVGSAAMAMACNAPLMHIRLFSGRWLTSLSALREIDFPANRWNHGGLAGRYRVHACYFYRTTSWAEPDR